MPIRVKVFAMLREVYGCDEINVDCESSSGDSPTTVITVLNALKSKNQEMASVLEHSLVAVNGRFADLDQCLYKEDEVAILPPVSGG